MLLADLVERNARRVAQKQAVHFGGAANDRTWAQLAQRSWRLSNAVSALASRGNRVAILAENCAEYYECYYGVPDSGAVLTLLNYRLHPRELVWIMNNAEATVLIAQSCYAKIMQDLRNEMPHLRQVITIGDSVAGTLDYESFLQEASPVRSAVANRDDPAWVVYTSGTTGHPKGAMLSHHNLMTGVIQSVVHYTPGPDARFLNAFPLCHVAGYMAIVHQFRGGMVAQQGAWDPDAWLQTVAEQRITSGGMAPSMLKTVLDSPAIDKHDTSSLQALGYGSASLSADILRRAIDRFGPVMFTGFGMTELGGNVLALDRATHERAARGDEHLLMSAGSAMCMSDAKVIDDAGEQCAPGVVGELVVRGDQTMIGYLGRPEATAEAYDGGWFHTGDLAHADEEGYFYIVDRKKDMIITGGENVYSVEVENALGAHAAVAEAAVFGLPDPQWGEIVVAAVVLRAGAQASTDDLVSFCRTQLAGYKRPREIHFVAELPKTVTGKALKRDLRRQYGEAAPQTSAPL